MRELFENMERDYKINGKRDGDLKKRWAAHLEPVFGADLASPVTTTRIRKYIEARLAENAAPATVKLELAALRRMFRLGYQEGKVVRVPHFPTIAVNNARTGFFEHEAFERVLGELPSYLRPLATVGYWMGWRKGELLGLERRQVDLDTGKITLDPGTTKNKERRFAYLPSEALEALQAWDEQTRAHEREHNVIIRHVFHNEGNPLRSIDAAWKSACKRAGVAGMLFHDLRRTACQTYRQNGVSEGVVMKILGHKTRSMFDRYNIVAEDDFKQAATVVDAPRNGTIMGPVVDFEAKRKERDGR